MRSYREMVVLTTDLVRNAIEDGKSIEEMREGRLLVDWTSWDSRLYEWINTDFWLDTIFRSVVR